MPYLYSFDRTCACKKIYNENVTLFELLNFTDLRAQSIKYSINELTLLGLRNKFPLPDNSRIQPNSNLFNIKLEKTKHILKITPKEVYEFRQNGPHQNQNGSNGQGLIFDP